MNAFLLGHRVVEKSSSKSFLIVFAHGVVLGTRFSNLRCSAQLALSNIWYGSQSLTWRIDNAHSQSSAVLLVASIMPEL